MFFSLSFQFIAQSYSKGTLPTEILSFFSLLSLPLGCSAGHRDGLAFFPLLFSAHSARLRQDPTTDLCCFAIGLQWSLLSSHQSALCSTITSVKAWSSPSVIKAASWAMLTPSENVLAWLFLRSGGIAVTCPGQAAVELGSL